MSDRKTVLVLSPEGDAQQHIKNSEAFAFVQQGKAMWLADNRSIRMHPRIIVPRGVAPTEFTDVWKLIPSGGSKAIPVWQIPSEAS